MFVFAKSTSKLAQTTIAWGAVSLVLIAFCSTAAAQEKPKPTSGGPNATTNKEVPGAPHLLPHDTMIYLRFDDANQIREDLGSSSLGKMFADPKLRPLAGDLYNTLAELFQTVGQRFDLTLDELLAIPSGQVAIAAFPRVFSDEELGGEEEEDGKTADKESDEAIRRRIDQKRRAQTSMAGLVIIDAGKNIDKLREVVDRILELPINQGYVRREQNIGSATLVRLMPPRTGRPEIQYFEKENCLVLGVGYGTASGALERWLDRSKEPTFAENTDFAAVMGRCLGAEETRPQMTFFADPYHLVERLVKRGGTAALVWPIFEDLGIAKIRGVGGSVFRGGEVFDDISHLHVLVDPPRDGVFGVLRPEKVETIPPTFVPSDVTTYLTVKWDLETTFDNFSKIIDRFQGEGTAKRLFEDGVKQRLDMDVREDVLSVLTGRYVTCSWIQPPAKLNSQARIHAFELSDATKAEATLEKVIKKAAPNLKPEMLGLHKLYTSKAGGANFSPRLRRPEPSVMILGKWLLLSDSRELMERATRAEGGSLQTLINVPDYDLVSSELGGKLDGEKPFMISYVRGSDFLRQMYQMAESEDSRAFLKSAAENNPFAAKFYELLKRNELPPFEQFEKYFAPGGSFGYDEPTGIHLGSFTLKADAE